MPTIRVTKCAIFQFTIKNTAGVVDTTTAAMPGSSNTAAMKTVINPNNPREAAACVLSLSGVNMQNPILSATVAAFGHTQATNLTVAAAPDLSSVTIDAVSGEMDVPAWAAAQL